MRLINAGGADAKCGASLSSATSLRREEGGGVPELGKAVCLRTWEKGTQKNGLLTLDAEGAEVLPTFLREWEANGTLRRDYKEGGLLVLNSCLSRL